MEMETTKLWHLDSVEILQDLTYDEKMGLVDKTITQKYRKNDTVLQVQEKFNYLYCVAKGRVKRVRKVNEEEEYMIKFYDEGDFFGDLNLILPNQGKIAERDYLAMKHETVVCAIPYSLLKPLYSKNSGLKERLLSYYANEVVKNEIRLDSSLFKDVKHQLLDFIKDLARDMGKPIGKEFIIRHQLTHQDISNITGISRQKVTTLLNEFKREGMIYFERKNMLIKDKKLLPITN